MANYLIFSAYGTVYSIVYSLQDRKRHNYVNHFIVLKHVFRTASLSLFINFLKDDKLAFSSDIFTCDSGEFAHFSICREMFQ